MKRALCLFLALLFAFTLCSCGKKDDASSNLSNETIENVSSKAITSDVNSKTSSTASVSTKPESSVPASSNTPSPVVDTAQKLGDTAIKEIMESFATYANFFVDEQTDQILPLDEKRALTLMYFAKREAWGYNFETSPTISVDYSKILADCSITLGKEYNFKSILPTDIFGIQVTNDNENIKFALDGGQSMPNYFYYLRHETSDYINFTLYVFEPNYVEEPKGTLGVDYFEDMDGFYTQGISHTMKLKYNSGNWQIVSFF